MIHDYANNRYWDSIVGARSFPFTATRASNATMFNNEGKLVYAPANLIAQSSMAGAAVGVIGSGGALPTGWNSGAVPAGTTLEVVAVGPDYIDIRLYGTNSTGLASYPSIFTGGVITAVIGQPIMGSVYLQIIAGSFDGITYGSNGKYTVQFGNSGSYVSNTTASAQATTTMTRVTSAGSRATADHNQWRGYVVLGLNPGDTCDFTLRISKPQLEYTGVDSPKKYNETTGSAYYGPRIGKDPHTGINGLLVEPTRTNLNPESSATNGPSGMSEGAGASDLGFTSRRLTGSGAVVGHFCPFKPLIPAASTIHTLSALVKMVSGTRIQLTGSSSWSLSDCYVNFNLSLGTVVGSGAGAIASSITSCGNGWYRIAMTFTTTGAPTSGGCGVLALITGDADTRIPSNNSTDVFDVIGVQLEAGYGASSYIPTFYASATRASDTLSTTSISWLNQALGTWYAKFTPFNALDTNKRLMSIGDGTANNAASLLYTSTRYGQIRTAIGGAADLSPASNLPAAAFAVSKVAGVFTSPTKKIVLNAGVVGTASVAFPTSGYTTFKVGAEGDGTLGMLGYIHEIRYYPSASASDGQLQTLTT